MLARPVRAVTGAAGAAAAAARRGAATAAGTGTGSAGKAPLRITIVGGNAGGATAAARARRLDERAVITVLERGDAVSQAACGLPYKLGGEIKERSRLLLHTPASLSAALGVEVRPRTGGVGIDAGRKGGTVRTAGGAAGTAASTTSEGPYDKLLLATGAAPAAPPIPGLSLPGVYNLRSVSDMDALGAALDGLTAGAPVLVMGAGFVGLEVVEQLAHRGFAVTLVEARDHVLPNMDADMAGPLHTELRTRGVATALSTRVTRIEEVPGAAPALRVSLSDGTTTRVCAVVSAAGVVPETGLAAGAGLTVDPRSRTLVVDEHLRTSDPDVYAVGDAVTTSSLVDGSKRVWVPLGGPANRQARWAVDHMLGAGAGAVEPYRGTVGTAILRLFDVTAATTGASEAQLAGWGTPFKRVIVTSPNHASYYPGSTPITLKVLYAPDSGRVLGAAATGGDGVDKRMDVLSALILRGGTVYDLASYEPSYAPPFSAARDVLNVAGLLAQNIRDGLVRVVDALPAAAGDLVLDVRDATTAATRPLVLPPGSGARVLNVPLSDLRASLPVVAAAAAGAAHVTTVCVVGKSSYMAARILAGNGIPAASLMGGVTFHTGLTAAPLAAARTAAATPVPAVAAAAAATARTHVVDACGLACPGPLMETRKAANALAPGDSVRVLASDPGFFTDVQAFARGSGLEVTTLTKAKGIITAELRKPLDSTFATQLPHAAAAAPVAAAAAAAGGAGAGAVAAAPTPAAPALAVNPYDTSIILFSSDYDRVLAALVIANGAVAMGGKATIFATFWGLSALRRAAKGEDPWTAEKAAGGPAVYGDGDDSTTLSVNGSHPLLLGAVDRAMKAVLPAGVNALPLSHLNVAGLGQAAMRQVMASKQLPTLPSLMRSAHDSGKVRFVACTMSMSALGVAPADLLPGVELGGVADFLGAAATSKNTLFL